MPVKIPVNAPALRGGNEASARVRAVPPHAAMTDAAHACVSGLADFTAIPVLAWRGLHARALEPNAYYDPLWALPASRFARGLAGASALLAWDRNHRLTGLLPVRWAKQALHLPLPMLVAWRGYASLTVSLLDRTDPASAADLLLDAARHAGARALYLPGLTLDGPAAAALTQAAQARGLSVDILRSYRRAILDASGDGDATLRAALGAKKIKELRRQRHRLEDAGPLNFAVARTPDDVAVALEDFLTLEAKSWKGQRGTALMQDAGDAAFIRQAVPALAADGRIEIVSLTRNRQTIASGLVLRDAGRAYFFKIAMDESEARTSPGVQLTLDLTRHLCADPAIRSADSSTDSEHPMIDHVWRDRTTIGDVFIALKARDPFAAAIRNLLLARLRAIDLVKTIRRIREKLS
jgi:CelD/BcsL family acetyltransferase involved in cellulose biosynthesis